MINTALIGHGYWGSKLRRYLEADKRFLLRHVCDSKSKMEEVWHEVEAVVVATPIETHYQVVKQALLRGKHVFSEKPLTLKAKQGRELKKIAEKNKLVLAVEYTQTFSRSLKKAVQEIDIGQLQAMEMSVKHLGRFISHDVYWLLASHCLSILDMLIPLSKLKFRHIDFLTDQQRVETGQILFWNKQLRGQISVSLNFPGKVYQVVVYGQKGTIIYNPITPPSLRVVWYKKRYGLLPPNLIVKQKTWRINEMNNLKWAVDYFYQVLVGKKKTNLATAIKITQVLEKLQATKQF